MVSAAPAVSAQVPADLRLHAEELRREHRFPAALDAYRLLVVVDSGRFEDRFWVARIESWTGRLESAESAFVRLLVERPDDYDTRLALADVRTWRGEPAEARIVLEDLRRTHPTDPEVLRRLYVMDQVRAPARWEADLEYFGERLEGGSATNGATLSFGAIDSGRVGWRGAATFQEKFERTEARLGGEVSYRLRPPLELRLAAHLAPGATVLARQSYAVGAGHRVGRQVIVHAEYGFFDFADADVHRIGPAVEAYAGPWLVVARYGYAATRFAGLDGAVGNHAGSLTLGYVYHDANLVRVFAGAGGESFALPTREVIGGFQARTIGGAWRHLFTSGLGFEVVYARQFRSGGGDQDAFGLRLVQRW